MSFSNIKLPEENPFYRIKVRHVFAYWILIAVGIGIQVSIIMEIFFASTIEDIDPNLSILLEIFISLLTVALLWRHCNLVGINLKQVIGKIPNNYQWLPLIGLVIARVLFSRGIVRIFYYPVSFIAPSFIEKNLDYNIFSKVSETFAPALYYLLGGINFFIVDPLFMIFIFLGIALHRWTAKWGIRPAILAICLLFGVGSSPNVLGGISQVLIYTLLYIKTRTLIIPIIAWMLDRTLLFLIDEGFRIYRSTTGLSALEQFRSEWPLGVFFLVLSAPWLVRFIYKNWPRPNKQLPYFANVHNS